jgi:uncharacterized membrane protein YozB (DUF420 family)
MVVANAEVDVHKRRIKAADGVASFFGAPYEICRQCCGSSFLMCAAGEYSNFYISILFSVIIN